MEPEVEQVNPQQPLMPPPPPPPAPSAVPSAGGATTTLSTGAVPRIDVGVAWESLNDETGRIRCLACAHHCVITPGHTGICGVRRNQAGKLELLVYGRPTAVHVDPVEKKPLYHFLPGSSVLSIGTVGCNMACPWCQNWQISQVTRKTAGKSPLIELEDIGEPMTPDDIIATCDQQGLKVIAFTYNEPTIFLEYALDTMKLARQKGIASIFVTNGYESEEAMTLLRPYVSALNVDLKAFKDETYLRLCKAHLQPVLDTIRRAHSMGLWVEVTTLIVPGVNDSEEELRALCKWLASVSLDIPLHFSAFHPDFQMPETQPTPRRTLQRAKQIAAEEGLHWVYLGNVSDEGASQTKCLSCGETLVQRAGYQTRVIGLRSMPPTQVEPFPQCACRHCGASPIAGIWTQAQLVHMQQVQAEQQGITHLETPALMALEKSADEQRQHIAGRQRPEAEAGAGVM
ncbi:putative AmmeMemoRadiSam system radical SAM enzyme [Paratrimastix pyriformis]|uniref:AmmeMemoRadiSam system radical SAM enzyme n=1 Tax=Paratrimastix pyriformis TaxID=342808 RepID=A0ABQ8UJL0_9EUKA|nr:putative AmmeMemoRadiSam system radical SAM enzyme [Paratrimastix pyriformis]